MQQQSEFSWGWTIFIVLVIIFWFVHHYHSQVNQANQNADSYKAQLQYNQQQPSPIYNSPTQCTTTYAGVEAQTNCN